MVAARSVGDVGFVGLAAGPMIVSFYLSLTRFNMVDPTKFIEFENSICLITNDPTFWLSLQAGIYLQHDRARGGRRSGPCKALLCLEPLSEGV